MKKVNVLFKTDAWHSNDSKELMGVYESKENLIKDLKKENWIQLTDDDVSNLENINQTQDRQVNFIIEEIEINQIINQ